MSSPTLYNTEGKGEDSEELGKIMHDLSHAIPVHLLLPKDSTVAL